MTVTSPNWRTRAACLGSWDLFFAPEAESVAGAESLAAAQAREAKAAALCASCPVAAECFRFAGTVGARTGIWGGIDLGQRMCGNRRHVMTAANTQRRNDGTTCCRACRQATDKRYRQKQQQEDVAA